MGLGNVEGRYEEGFERERGEGKGFERERGEGKGFERERGKGNAGWGVGW